MNKHGGYKGANTEMLDFSININPLGMPEKLKQTLIDTLDTLGRYPEITGERAGKRIAQAIGMPENTVILGNGAIELIYLFTRSQRAEGGGKGALIPVPTFNEYKRALTMNDWENIKTLVLGPDTEFAIDPKILTERIHTEKPSAVFICNPTNPTGVLYEKEFLQALMDACDPEIIWFIDESFIEFTGIESCLSLVKDTSRRVLLLRSLTKFFGLPGLRIGYAVGSEPIIAAMAKYKEPWTINTLALKAAEVVYDDTDYMEKTRSFIAVERKRVLEAVQSIPHLEVFSGHADFHLYHLLTGDTDTLQEALNTRNINVRTCEDFAGLEKKYFRAAIKKREDNDRFIDALTEILGGEKWGV